MTEKTVINIDEVPLVDRGNGKQFAVKWGRVGPLVGLNSLSCAVHVVPPGKNFPSTVITYRTSCSSSCPGRVNIGLARRSSRFAAATSLLRRPERKRTSSSMPARPICATSVSQPREGSTSSIIPIQRRSRSPRA
jgi:hypothetical protein